MGTEDHEFESHYSDLKIVIMELLHTLLCTFLVICGLFVVMSTSPVESMISLILMFCISGVILFIFNSEFLGLTFIIIYVGAIAVLFLFIIMMLNIKKTFSISDNKLLLIVALAILASFLFICFKFDFFTSSLVFFDKSNANFVLYEENSLDNKYLAAEFNQLSYDSLTNITVLGQSLFNYYSLCFLLAGLVLLVALVGSVVLTVNFSTTKKNQLTYRQLSRSDLFLSHFKK